MIIVTFENEQFTTFNLTMTEDEPKKLIITYPKKKMRINDEKFSLLETALGPFYVEVPVDLIELTFNDDIELTFEYVRNFLAVQHTIDTMLNVYNKKAEIYKNAYVDSGMFLNDLIGKVYK